MYEDENGRHHFTDEEKAANKKIMTSRERLALSDGVSYSLIVSLAKRNAYENKKRKTYKPICNMGLKTVCNVELINIERLGFIREAFSEFN